MYFHFISALLRMSAVQEQKKKFAKYKENFAVALARQLNNLFVHQVKWVKNWNDFREEIDWDMGIIVVRRTIILYAEHMYLCMNFWWLAITLAPIQYKDDILPV